MEDSSSMSQRMSHPQMKVVMFHADAKLLGNLITLSNEPG